MGEAGLIAALSAAVTLLLRQFVAPFFTPWYEERERKAQFRVAHRVRQRQMIENELEKGFDDLSSARVIAMITKAGQKDALERGAALFGINEQKWGVWRPYLLEDKALLLLCEDFRRLIRDHRIEAMNLQPDALQARNQAVEVSASAQAETVMAEVRRKGW